MATLIGENKPIRDIIHYEQQVFVLFSTQIMGNQQYLIPKTQTQEPILLTKQELNEYFIQAIMGDGFLNVRIRDTLFHQIQQEHSDVLQVSQYVPKIQQH